MQKWWDIEGMYSRKSTVSIVGGATIVALELE